MLTIDSPGFSASARAYRFAGVEIDAARLQLRVDGRPVTCPPKSFELLTLLCRAPRKILPRAQLMDALWPGGQVVSDEALTQAIFRARAALGDYAGLITTVRGVGLRLDAQVTVPDKSAPAQAAPATGYESAGAGRQKNSLRLPLAFALLVVIAAGAVAFWPRSPAPVMLAAEYGLTEDAILAEQPDTAAMIVEALKSDAIGERGRGIGLLEAIHRSDASTPIPALFLAQWSSGQGQREAAREWLAEAQARMAGHNDLYLNLLYDYFAAEVKGDPEEIVYTAGAVLDARPEAWRMHHARAHLMEYVGMREAALREIAQIKVDTLTHRKLALVVADRASMGDVEGAQAILDRLDGDEEPAMFAFLAGRVAWSRGDFEAARKHFLEAVEAGRDYARRDIIRRSLIYAGAIEAMQGRDVEALLTLERARGESVGHSRINEIDTSLSIAQLHQLAGNEADAFRALERALELSNSGQTDGVELHAWFAAMRLRPGSPVSRPGPLAPEADALWQAAELIGQGDFEGARLAVIEAVNRGVLETRLADEARWMQLKLGLPVPEEAVLDPPYPPLSRVVLRREIRDTVVAQGMLAGPLRP